MEALRIERSPTGLIEIGPCQIDDVDILAAIEAEGWHGDYEGRNAVVFLSDTTMIEALQQAVAFLAYAT